MRLTFNHILGMTAIALAMLLAVTAPASARDSSATRSVSERTTIPKQTGEKVIVNNLKGAKAFKRQMEASTKLRRNFGWRVVVNFPYFRVACPIGIVSGVVVAVYRYRNGTGFWPTPGMVYSWTSGACG